jgi:glycosyltransferase involved in cell wall biosynthesis
MMSSPNRQPDQLDPPAIRVCLIQAYRAPLYIRGVSLKTALTSSASVSLSLAMNHSAGIRRYREAIRGLLRIRRELDPEIYILAFRGHEIAWLVRRLTRGRSFVFDAMMSPYAALEEERKFDLPGARLLAKLWRPFERSALTRADAVLTDTELHSEYLQSRFRIPAEKIIVVPVGAVEPPHNLLPSQAPGNVSLRVLFYGSFLPLHGIDVVLDAADMLRDLPVFFDFIGGSAKDARKLAARMSGPGTTRYSHRAWVPFDDLLETEIPAADLCLGGPFGDTPQSRRVITGKTHQFLASGKATVIGIINEDCGFVHKANCLLVEQGNAVALADAIRWAHENRGLLPSIGAAGRRLHEERYSSSVIGARLVEALSHLARPRDLRGCA